MTQFNFDASQVTPDMGRPEPIPAGTYRAQILKTELKNTKSGSGIILYTEFSILGGEFDNRKVFANLNVINNNPIAQQIGQGLLSAICHAVGVMKVDDNTLPLLCNRPLSISVVIEEGSAKGDGTFYAARNGITGFYKEKAEEKKPKLAIPIPQAPKQTPPTVEQPWANANPKKPATPKETKQDELPVDNSTPDTPPWAL
jgi:hypothetical protein